MHITTIAAVRHDGIDFLKVLQAAEDQIVSTSISTLKLIGDTAIEDLPKYLQEVSSRFSVLTSHFYSPYLAAHLICFGLTRLVLHVPSSPSAGRPKIAIITSSVV